MTTNTSSPANNKKKSLTSIHVSVRVKMLVIFTLLFMVVFAVAFYWFFQFATQLALDGVANDLTAIAEHTAANIDGDAHQALYESDIASGRPLDNGQYLAIVEWLDLIKKTQGMAIGSDGTENFKVLLYTYTGTGEPGVVDFIGSSSALNQPPGGAEFRESYRPQSNAMRDGLNTTTVNIANPVSDQWGIWVSGFAPIHNSQGDIVGAVGVDMRDTTVVALQNQIKNAVIPAFVITYAVLFAAVFLISYGISRPIISLTKIAERIGEGDYNQDLSRLTTDRFPDEINTLTEVFEIMMSKVRKREEGLKKQVAELKIEIDEVKRSQQVSEIVDSDFFQDLQAKARAMRKRGPAQQDSPEDNP